MGTSLISPVPSQGHACRLERTYATTGTVVCSLGQLSGGKTVTTTIVLAVDESLTPALAESIIHSAKVIAESADPDLSNNELRESIPVSSGTHD